MRIRRAMVVLFDDRDNVVSREHVALDVDVEPGAIITVRARLQAEAMPDEDE